MGVIHDFPRAHDYVIRQVDSSVREAFARFDAAFDVGQELPDGESDLRMFGRWAQMRLSLGEDGGHDYDERVLRVTRLAAEGDIPWTAEDVRFLWSVANSLMTWRHTNYLELYRIPLAAIRTAGLRGPSPYPGGDAELVPSAPQAGLGRPARPVGGRADRARRERPGGRGAKPDLGVGPCRSRTG